MEWDFSETIAHRQNKKQIYGGETQMKKKLYYVMPFIVVTILMLLVELIDNTLLNMTPYIMGGLLVLASAIFGFFSPSKNKIDYLITLTMPISLFCFMFVAGFLSKSDLETRFHIDIAANAAFQPICLILYLAMAIMALVASLDFFRNLKSRTAN